MFCGTCGHECDWHIADFGVGPFEHFGQCGADKNDQAVSDCHDATIFQNEELTIEQEIDPGPDPDAAYEAIRDYQMNEPDRFRRRR